MDKFNLQEFKNNLLKKQAALELYKQTLNKIRESTFVGNITETCDDEYLTVMIMGVGADDFYEHFAEYFDGCFTAVDVNVNELIVFIEFESIDL
jgi:hypothetical protein